MWIAVAVGSALTTGAVATNADTDLSLNAPGHLVIDVRDQATQRRVPARIRIVPHGFFRATEHRISASGRVDVKLPAGGYDVIVSHGPEWSIAEHAVDVEAGAELRIETAIQREVDATGYTACDFHVHTNHSPDSDVDETLRADTLRAEDVHFAVVTDHNHVSQVEASFRPHALGSVPGVEVTTWEPEFGHFNVFPVQKAPAYKHSDPVRLLRELRADAASFIQINHPRLEDHIGYFELLGIEPTALAGDAHAPLAFDGIEVWNGYDLARPARRDRIFEEWLALLARGHRLVATGNSDSHSDDRTLVGYPRTYVQVPRERAADSALIVATLKAGRAFVSSGPILHVEVEGANPGDKVTLPLAKKTVRVRIAVDGPDWMDLSQVQIWLGERMASEIDLATVPTRASGARHVVERDVVIGDALFLVAVVRGERDMAALIERTNARPYAFSNPVWLSRW